MHEFAVAAGYIGAAFSVGMVVPQLVRTLRHRGLGGVSAISWLITTAACFTWLLYGVKGHVWPQVPGNALIIPCATAIVLTVPGRLTVPRRAVLLAATAAVLITIALLVRPVELGYLAFVISLVAATPQAVKSVVRRGTGRSAVSIPAWLMRGGSQVFWLYYALVLHNGPTAVASVVTMFSTAVVITVESASLISARLGRDHAAPLPQVEDPA